MLGTCSPAWPLNSTPPSSKPRQHLLLPLPPQEHRDYWAGVLQGVEKPTAAKLLDHVDPSYLLGLPPAEAAGPPALGTRRKSVPVLAYFMQARPALRRKRYNLY